MSYTGHYIRLEDTVVLRLLYIALFICFRLARYNRILLYCRGAICFTIRDCTKYIRPQRMQLGEHWKRSQGASNNYVDMTYTTTARQQFRIYLSSFFRFARQLLILHVRPTDCSTSIISSFHPNYIIWENVTTLKTSNDNNLKFWTSEYVWSCFCQAPSSILYSFSEKFITEKQGLVRMGGKQRK